MAVLENFEQATAALAHRHPELGLETVQNVYNAAIEARSGVAHIKSVPQRRSAGTVHHRCPSLPNIDERNM